MPIIRVRHNKDNPYFQLNRHALENPDLSFKAKGLHAYLMSKPDDWRVLEKNLVNSSTEGRDAIRSALKELRKLGYVERVKVKCERTGRFVDNELVVYETPIKQGDAPDRLETRPPGNPDAGQPHPTQKNDSSEIPSLEGIEKNGSERLPPSAGNPARHTEVSSSHFAEPGPFDPTNGERTTVAKPSQRATQAAGKLANALYAKGRFVGRRKPNAQKWAKELDSWVASGEITWDTIDPVLLWYIGNIGAKFVPVADSVSGFRAKFVSIRDQMERQNEDKPNGTMDDNMAASVSNYLNKKGGANGKPR